MKDFRFCKLKLFGYLENEIIKTQEGKSCSIKFFIDTDKKFYTVVENCIK